MVARVEYRKSEASRQQVIAAAIQTLAKRGLAQTSVSDIADAAGMSKGVVHYHFKSKDDLLGRVLDACVAAIHTRTRRAWDEAKDPLDKIRSYLREGWASRTDGSPEMRVIAELAAQGVHDPRMREAISTMFQTMREQLVRDFVECFAEIGLRPKIPPRVVPRLVMATLDGLGLHHMFDPPTEADQKEILRSLELLAFSLFEL